MHQLLRLPALKSAAQSPEIGKDPLLIVALQQALAGKPMPMVVEMRAIWDAMRPQLTNVLNQKINSDEAARRMQEDAVRKIKEMNE